MFQLSLFTEFGRLCNPFDYVLGFTFLLMAFHLLFLLFNLRERQRVKLFCLGSASLVLLLHIAALRLSFQSSVTVAVRAASPPKAFAAANSTLCVPAPTVKSAGTPGAIRLP